VAGIPAQRIGWMSPAGERLGDDLVCPRTGRRFEERDVTLPFATLERIRR
jgi:UDP-2-acetamido-3-amino-2,3-dideoxy-glucuronate N-acetyltransferase